MCHKKNTLQFLFLPGNRATQGITQIFQTQIAVLMGELICITDTERIQYQVQQVVLIHVQ